MPGVFRHPPFPPQFQTVKRVPNQTVSQNLTATSTATASFIRALSKSLSVSSSSAVASMVRGLVTSSVLSASSASTLTLLAGLVYTRIVTYLASTSSVQVIQFARNLAGAIDQPILYQTTAFANPTAAGNLILAFAAWNYNVGYEPATSTSVQDSQGNIYTSLGTIQSQDGASIVEVFYTMNTSSAPLTLTMGQPDRPGHPPPLNLALEISGANSSPIEVSVTFNAVTGSTTPVTPSFTISHTATVFAFIWEAAFSRSSNGSKPGTGYIRVYPPTGNPSQSASGVLEVANNLLPGTYTASFDFTAITGGGPSTTTGAVFYVVAIRALPGAGAIVKALNKFFSKVSLSTIGFVRDLLKKSFVVVSTSSLTFLFLAQHFLSFTKISTSSVSRSSSVQLVRSLTSTLLISYVKDLTRGISTNSTSVISFIRVLSKIFSSVDSNTVVILKSVSPTVRSAGSTSSSLMFHSVLKNFIVVSLEVCGTIPRAVSYAVRVISVASPSFVRRFSNKAISATSSSIISVIRDLSVVKFKLSTSVTSVLNKALQLEKDVVSGSTPSRTQVIGKPFTRISTNSVSLVFGAAATVLLVASSTGLRFLRRDLLKTVLGTVNNVVAIGRGLTRTVSATSVSLMVVVKALTKAVTLGSATSVATVAKSIPKALVALSLGVCGAIIRGVFHLVVAMSTATASLVLNVSVSRVITGAAFAGGVLRKALSRLFNSSSTSSVSIVASRTRLIVISAVSSSAVFFKRSIARIFSVGAFSTLFLIRVLSSTSSSVVSSSTKFIKSVSKSTFFINSTGLLTFVVTKMYSRVFTSSSATAIVFTKGLSKIYSQQSFEGARFTRGVSRSFSVASTGSAVLNNIVGRVFTVVSSGVSFVIRRLGKIVVLQSFNSAVLNRSFTIVVVAASVAAATIVKSINRTITAVSTSVRTILVNITHVLNLSITSTGSPVVLKRILRSIQVTALGANAFIFKVLGLRVTVTSSSSTFLQIGGRIFTAAITAISTSTATFVAGRVFSKILSRISTSVSVRINSVGKNAVATSTAAFSIARLYGKSITQRSTVVSFIMKLLQQSLFTTVGSNTSLSFLPDVPPGRTLSVKPGVRSWKITGNRTFSVIPRNRTF